VSAAPANERSALSSLEAALAPFPGRWNEAVLVAVATTTALAVAIILQVPSFAAPNLAFVALQRTTVCTWHNMVRRVLIAVAAGLVLVPVGGFLVQTPWLLVPVFFLAVAALTYGVPSARNPVEAILIAFPLVTVCFSGTYDPASIAVSTRDLIAASVIGVVVATVFAQLSSRPNARLRLADSLAASFARSHQRLRRTLAVYQAPEWTPTRDEAPVLSELGNHVQLLDLARQEGLGPITDRTLVTLSTAAERLETFVGTIDTLSRQNVGRVYRRAIAAQLEALCAALDAAFAAFADVSRRLGTHDETDPDAAARGWPDLSGCVTALQTRQLDLRGSPDLATVDVAESGNLNALVQSLVSLADVLHTPPWELHHLAAAERLDAPPVWPWSVLPLDRFALRFALQVALGATIALVIGFAAHVAELSTLLWNPLLVAQMSYGATIRKAWLRLGGVLAGGALALLTIIAVFANTTDLAVWLAVLFAVLVACQYVVLGAPLNWYGPFQIAVTYFVVLVAAEPTMDVRVALWRAFGTFAGTAILFAVFRLVAPDYAGRQLVARFGDLLRTTLLYLPRPGDALAPIDQLVAARIASARCSADILRLVDEARLEGHASGIDADAAVEAAGIAARVSLRAGLIARGRATAVWPALSAAPRARLAELRQATREHLEADLRILDARHTMARPGTRAHHEARRAAAEHAARQRPDLAGSFAELVALVGEARRAELLAWPIDAAGALLAEVEHFRRIVELLPRLDAALEKMILPDGPLPETRENARAVAALAAGAVTRP